MAYADNPAGRLWTLLNEYQSDPSRRMDDAWAKIIGVPVEDLGLHLGRVSELVKAVRYAYEDLGEPGYEPLLNHLRDLSICVWPRNLGMFHEVSENLPPTAAMEYLATFDAYLHRVAPEGQIPTKDMVADLVPEVRETIQAVISSELDPALKRMILTRLNEVLEALEHLNVGGPDSIRRATESLAAMTSALDEANAGDPDLRDKLKSVSSKVYMAFRVSATVLALAHGAQAEVVSLDHLLWPPHHAAQISAPSSTSHELAIEAEVVADDEHTGA